MQIRHQSKQVGYKPIQYAYLSTIVRKQNTTSTAILNDVHT